MILPIIPMGKNLVYRSLLGIYGKLLEFLKCYLLLEPSSK